MNDETMRELIRQGRGPVGTTPELNRPAAALSEAERDPFYEHVDPTNSDANADALIEHVESLLAERLAAAWDDGMLAFSRGLGSDANPWSR